MIGHALVKLSCPSNVFLFQITESERVLGVVIARRYLQRLLKLASGFVKLAHHEIALAEHVMRDWVLCVSRKHTLERLDAFRELPEMKLRDREVDQAGVRCRTISVTGFEGGN